MGVINACVKGILSACSVDKNDFGFIAFDEEGAKGEVVIPKSGTKDHFDLQKYILKSLRNDLIYEQKGEIKELLKGIYEYSSKMLMGDICSSLLLNNKIVWLNEYEEELTLEVNCDALPSDSRFVGKQQ